MWIQQLLQLLANMKARLIIDFCLRHTRATNFSLRSTGIWGPLVLGGTKQGICERNYKALIIRLPGRGQREVIIYYGDDAHINQRTCDHDLEKISFIFFINQQDDKKIKYCQAG